MKTLITYNSETGNTKKIAEAIYQDIKGPKEILKIDEVLDVDSYDLIVVGFPIHQFGPSKKAIKFFDEKMNNKSVVLLITHAVLKDTLFANKQL